MYVRVVCDVFFFKQKTAYEMRISDWSSDVCSSDLAYFALALVLLWADLDAVAALARSPGPADAFLAVGVVVAAVGVCAPAREAARPPTDGARAAPGWTMVAPGATIAYHLAGWQGPSPQLNNTRFSPGDGRRIAGVRDRPGDRPGGR